MGNDQDGAFWSSEKGRHSVEVAVSGIAEARRRPRHGNVGTSPLHPFDEGINRAIFEDPGWRVIKQRRLDDGN